MERLETKKINGHVYYYYSRWGWKNGKCRRLWQKYLGSMQDLMKILTGERDAPLCAEIFQWGLPMALWKEARRAETVSIIDQLCPKRNQGITTGQYLTIAAINRAMQPCSKRSMWGWFSQTVLMRVLPRVTEEGLASQRFWDHMERIGEQEAQQTWKRVFQGVVYRESVNPESISYDGTNFYTFIDTFNTRCELARRGKNKQGRENLRQVSYALFCCADGPLPMYYGIYEGNRNDAKQFPLMLKQFQNFFLEATGYSCGTGNVTLVFDKGNNSQDNFGWIDTMALRYVGSVKLDEHKELAQEANQSKRFSACQAPGLESTKAFRVRKTVYGKERVLVVTYNVHLFEAQWETVHNDMTKALEKLANLVTRLDGWRLGVGRRGKQPSGECVRRQVADILSRPHMKEVIRAEVRDEAGFVVLEYCSDPDAVDQLKDTYLGKNILVTDREEWDNDRIIRAYRSQYLIEGVFKEMKDRVHGNWWPLHHWTDSKIRVHALYCTLALLFRGLMMRRLAQNGLRISLHKAMQELSHIQEVLNFFPVPEKKGRGRKKSAPVQAVLTRRTELQEKILSILGLQEKEPI